jgi:hypothetical protein
VRLRRVRTRRFPLEPAWLLSEHAVGIAAAVILAVLVVRAVA